jgi:hypothetical protein
VDVLAGLLRSVRDLALIAVQEQALGEAVCRILIILDDQHAQMLVRDHGDTSRNRGWALPGAGNAVFGVVFQAGGRSLVMSETCESRYIAILGF